MINFDYNSVFFSTEDASSTKKLSVELPSKIPPFRSLTKKLILNDSVAECGKHVGDMFISRYFVCLEVSLLAEESQNIQNSLANENFKQRSQYSLKQKTKKKHSDL